MTVLNEIKFTLPSKSCNESLARTVVSAFASQLDPSVSEIGEIKTAVSEAVTNCIVHAYPEGIGLIAMRCRILKDNILDTVCGSVWFCHTGRGAEYARKRFGA